MAGRRHAGQPACLAHPGGLAQDGRPVPERRGAPAARGTGRLLVAGPGRAGPGARRHADAHADVLSSGPVPRCRDTAHAARRRRPHHPRDRGRVSRPRGDHGAADQPGQGEAQGLRRAVHAAATGWWRRTAAFGAARAVPDLQRGIRGQRWARPGAHRPVRRGGPAGPRRARGPAGRCRGHRTARADAADRRPAPRAHRPRRRTCAARSAGPYPLGPPAHHRGPDAAHRRPAPGRAGRVPAAGGHRGPARPGRQPCGHRLAADPGPVQPAGGDDRQPDGRAEPGRRHCHGAGPGRGAGATGRPGRPAWRPPPAAFGAGPPAGAGRGHRWRDRRVRSRRRPHHEPARAGLPGDEGSPARGRAG